MKYYLVLEKRPNDFMTIDINILLNNSLYQDYCTLEAIDMFTKKYRMNELYVLIQKNNIVPEKYLFGNLKIINEKKYRYPIFTKEIDLSLDDFFSENINNKNVMNKVINIYQKFSNKDIDMLKESIKNKDIVSILQIIFALPYEDIRKIYFYIIENIIQK